MSDNLLSLLQLQSRLLRQRLILIRRHMRNHDRRRYAEWYDLGGEG